MPLRSLNFSETGITDLWPLVGTSITDLSCYLSSWAEAYFWSLRVSEECRRRNLPGFWDLCNWKNLDSVQVAKFWKDQLMDLLH